VDKIKLASVYWDGGYIRTDSVGLTGKHRQVQQALIKAVKAASFLRPEFIKTAQSLGCYFVSPLGLTLKSLIPQKFLEFAPEISAGKILKKDILKIIVIKNHFSENVVNSSTGIPLTKPA